MGKNLNCKNAAKVSVSKSLIMEDLVFINRRTGEPAKNSFHDTHPYKLCDKAGIQRFCKY